MGFDPVIASRRFGMGRSPDRADPASVAEMLARLTGPDRAAMAYPIPGMATMTPSIQEFRRANRDRREARGTEAEEAATEAVQALRQEANANGAANGIATFCRAMTTDDGLRERLTAFWADHFTVRSRQGISRHFVTPYVEDAIRPHLTGGFDEMLFAVVTHPMMLSYLDQYQSVGPNSRNGERRNRGLNENLAREVLELHTLGVGGAYGQADVTQLAELFTGLSLNGKAEFAFRPDFAEPGAEEVLGRSYGGGEEPALADIRAALRDIAVHPDTARHLARKLAVHFVADDPPEALVAALADRWRDSGGQLTAVTEALLSHPAAWAPEARKVQPPQQFLMSAMRALAVRPETLTGLSLRDLRRGFDRPLVEMGQPWEQPPGPDGWPEAAEAWVTPQGMATRITWAMAAPEKLVDPLPDPRDFALTALGPDAPQQVRFAAGAAESRAEGVGVVLASAAFQRR